MSTKAKTVITKARMRKRFREVDELKIYLDGMRKLIEETMANGMTAAKARRKVRRLLKRLGYQPEGGK